MAQLRRGNFPDILNHEFKDLRIWSADEIKAVREHIRASFPEDKAEEMITILGIGIEPWPETGSKLFLDVTETLTSFANPSRDRRHRRTRTAEQTEQ